MEYAVHEQVARQLAYLKSCVDTEIEALKDCKIHFRMLQNKHNPEDDSF